MTLRKHKAAEDEDDGGKSRKTSAHSSASTRVTRGMMADAARKAVLATAELLEEVLKHLPIKRIFASQRVCRQFRDVIQSSSQLQRRMFLKPSANARLTWSVCQGGPRFGGPPEEDRERGTIRKDEDVSVPVSPGTQRFTPVRLCPLLQPHSPTAFGWVDEAYAGFGVFVSLDLSKGLTGQASWKKVFLSDPPCQSAELLLAWHLKARPAASACISTVTVHDTAGLTLGRLVDAVMNTNSRIHYRSGRETKVFEDGSLADLVLSLEEAGRKKTDITKATWLCLHGIGVQQDA